MDRSAKTPGTIAFRYDGGANEVQDALCGSEAFAFVVERGDEA